MNIFIQRFVAIAAIGLFALAAVADPKAGHVFIVSIDGGKPAVIAQSAMPTLQGLAAEGAHTWAASTVFPSITLPSHVSMLTGLRPAKHKVLWNSWKPAKGVVSVPTVFSLAKSAGLTTAMFVGKEKFRHLAVSNSLDHFEFKVVSAGVVKKSAGDPKMADEKTVRAKFVAREAAAYILENKPNLCFIHLTDPDDAGHKYGWGSSEQIQAFADVDAALEVIFKAVQDAGIAGQSVMIITADHGGHRKTHGLNIPADMNIPWIAWGKGVKEGFEITAPVNTCDTAATALWLLGVAIPSEMDGRVVSSAFKSDPEPLAGPVAHAAGEDK